jgi:hypothetical protein
VYKALSDILQTLSLRFPVPWAFLVTGVIAATGFALYGAWELVAGRLPFASSRSRKLRGR